MSEEKDMVNRPAHYNSGGIECIDAMRAMLGEEGFIAYCKGSAFKYTWRSGLKFDEGEDLKKAVWYTRMANDDDPRLDPNAALQNAASLYSRALDDGTLTVDGPPDDAARGYNFADWRGAARRAGWTPPDERAVDE